MTLAGRVDGTVTRLNAVRLLSGHCPPGQHHRCCTGRQTTDQQPRHPNRGVSRKQESGRLPAPDTLTVVGIAHGADRGSDVLQLEVLVTGWMCPATRIGVVQQLARLGRDPFAGPGPTTRSTVVSDQVGDFGGGGMPAHDPLGNTSTTKAT